MRAFKIILLSMIITAFVFQSNAALSSAQCDMNMEVHSMSMNDNMADASPCDMQGMENKQVSDNMQSDCDMDDCSSCCTPISKTFLPLITPIHPDQTTIQVSGSPN